MSDQSDPPVSPTGKALVSASWVPWLLVASILLGAVASAPALGLDFIPREVSASAGALELVVLTLLGIGPGLRRR